MTLGDEVVISQGVWRGQRGKVEAICDGTDYLVVTEVGHAWIPRHMLSNASADA